MKLNEVLYDDKDRLLELAIFMSLNPHQLNEADGDWRTKFKQAAQKAGLKLGGSERGLLSTLSKVSKHISKIIYYAIKAKGGDRPARDELKKLLKRKATKEDLIDFFFKLDTLTLSILTGPINIIDALTGWNIVSSLKDKGKTPNKRIKDAITALTKSIEGLSPRIKKRVSNNLDKIKKMVLTTEGCNPKITRREMKDAALIASFCVTTNKKKWKVSKRAAKRKYGEASSAAKNRYAEKHYRESGGTYK